MFQHQSVAGKSETQLDSELAKVWMKPLGIEDGSAAIYIGGKELSMVPPVIMPLPERASFRLNEPSGAYIGINVCATRGIMHFTQGVE